jgi:hypothetical protein
VLGCHQSSAVAIMIGEESCHDQFTWAARRSIPPTKVGRQSGSGSLTREGRPRTATLATSSMPDERATQRRGRRQATTHAGVGATTAVRTAYQHRSPPGPACSAGRSARRAFRNISASPRPSTSTRGRRTPVYGLTTIAWHASWAEPPPTRSSSSTYHYTSLTRRGRGSSTCRPVRFTTGTTWSAPLWGTSRAHTYTLETPGICARAPRSPARRSGTSYGASPSAARSSRAWPSPRSYTPSSRARPADTSCASSGAVRPLTPTSCSTSPPALPPARRRWGPSSTGRRASAWTTPVNHTLEPCIMLKSTTTAPPRRRGGQEGRG